MTLHCGSCSEHFRSTSHTVHNCNSVIARVDRSIFQNEFSTCKTWVPVNSLSENLLQMR